MSIPRLDRHEVASTRLPPALDGLQILQLSDLHVCRRSRRLLPRVTRAIADLAIDLVVCTGDTVNGARYWEAASRWLAELPVPPEVPRVAVPGNWDYRSGGEAPFRRCMQSAGFAPLINEAKIIAFRGDVLQVAGFDDLRGGRFCPEAALAPLDAGTFILALSHTPDMILHLDIDRFDLMLSGHTHGGQVQLPSMGALITSTQIGRAYAQGLFALNSERFLYVSRGLGEGHVPVRYRSPPELALITLKTILGGTCNPDSTP